MPNREFADRAAAGERLASLVPDSLHGDTVVVGLARGGVAVAAEVARRLGAPLDVVAVRKVGHPRQPEYALGAVAPDSDGVYLRSTNGLTRAQLSAEVERAVTSAAELDERLHAHHPPLDLRGRTVVLVDDGLATGATMVAAIRWARKCGAERVAAAVPVAAATSATLVRREADEFVCVHETDRFSSVSTWYRRFEQLDDDTVVRLLDDARNGRGSPPVAGA